MAKTVQNIFDEAVHLIDAQNENSGSTEGSDVTEYRVRCCQLLNSLLNEVFPCSDTYHELVDPFLPGDSYSAGDKVEYDGRKYLCIATGVTTAPPTDATAWKSVAVIRAGRRPVLQPVTALTDPVDLDDFICMSVLPVGLAALFVFDEDLNKYNAYWGDYLDRLKQARVTLPAGPGDDGNGFEDIVNPYGGISAMHGGIEHGQFGAWPF